MFKVKQTCVRVTFFSSIDSLFSCIVNIALTRYHFRTTLRVRGDTKVGETVFEATFIYGASVSVRGTDLARSAPVNVSGGVIQKYRGQKYRGQISTWHRPPAPSMDASAGFSRVWARFVYTSLGGRAWAPQAPPWIRPRWLLMQQVRNPPCACRCEIFHVGNSTRTSNELLWQSKLNEQW